MLNRGGVNSFKIGMWRVIDATEGSYCTTGEESATPIDMISDAKKILSLDIMTNYYFLAARFFFLLQEIFTHRKKKSCAKKKGAFDSAKNHKRQRRKRQSVTAKREKSQTPKFV